jgi:hypothetical protein
MSDDRPRLSDVLQSARSLKADGKWYTLTLDDGTSVAIYHDVLYSPVNLKRKLAEELPQGPANDYPQIDAEASGVHALEDDIDALLARTGERGDE